MSIKPCFEYSNILENNNSSHLKSILLFKFHSSEIGTALPPTIRLQPTRSYSGSPIGSTYSISIFTTKSDTRKPAADKAEVIQMVFWVTEVFPPIVDIKPMVSLSRANVFADGEIFLQVELTALAR